MPGSLGLFVLQHVAAVSALAVPSDDERTRLDAERAAQLVGFVDARLSEIEGRREYTEQQEYDRIIAALRARFTPRELDDLERQGRQWTLERAMSEAFDAQPDSG